MMKLILSIKLIFAFQFVIITIFIIIFFFLLYMQTQQNTDPYIPKIDISSLLQDFNSEKAQNVIKQIDEACRNVGFFSIVNHGVSKDLINKLLAKIRQLFYLPLQTKLQAAAKKFNSKNKHVYRGYFPSSVNGKQGMDIKDPQQQQLPEKYKDNYFYETNFFPPGLSEDWQPTVSEYYTQLHNLAILLTKVLMYAFGKIQKWDQFQEGLKRPFNLTTLRFNYYPKHEKGSQPVQISKQDGAELACETHVDSVIFTILYQDSQGGLQVKNSKTGQWHTVPFDENAFVVNTGKTTEILTNGRYPATWHRVLMNYHERISIPFFFEPAADAILDPNMLVEGETKYKKQTYEQFIKESLKKFKQYVRDEEKSQK